MDWLSPYHAILDWQAKIVTLVMPVLPRLEWRGSSVSASSLVISFLKARHMVEKGYLAYLAYVRDTTTEIMEIDLVPVVREFSDVFPSDLPGMLPDRDIDFCIDLAPDTQPIYIPPYIMALKELKELKEQLEELLAKGFIKARQFDDLHLLVLKETVLQGGSKEVVIDEDGVLRLQGRLCVPNVDVLRKKILKEAHNSRYSIHLGATNMYRDLRQHYWRRQMKKDIVEYVVRCLNCQQVKYEHKRPGGLLQQMVILEWKWERLTMDFVVGLPRSLRKFDVVWVIVDRLTKLAYFIPVFWRAVQSELGTRVELSTAFHPKTDRQSERTVQIVEDKLRACMSPFEALYGRQCHSPIGWFDPNEARLYGTGLVKDALEKVKLIQEQLRTTQSRQKSYTDRKEADPNEDPHVFIDRMQRMLRVMKGAVTESVELASYRLQDVAVDWYESWEWSREAEHEDHLRIVLRVLQKGKLYANFSKCEFWLNSIAFLGHIISSEDIRVDTQKIEAVKTWPRPTTPTEALKDKLTSAPVLILLEGTDGYVIYCDASGIRLGCVLMQHDKFVAYAYRQLRKHEKNYPTHNLELAIVIHALKMWRHYLYSIYVDIYMDHKSLQYIFKQKKLNLHQRRWLELLKGYDVDILYHPGKANDTTTSSLVTKVMERQYEDPVLVHHRDTTPHKEKTPFEITEDGVLRYQGRLCVPNVAGLRRQVMGETQYSRYSIHPGMTKMYPDKDVSCCRVCFSVS
ncbi:uncharacterized protein [Nicotiana tomentosiformis]|uniref:uncharacterized protein n=1 Tax=Nicotiana tomentosiformis TaxID=4098 RepID=UPI00388C7512